MKNKDKSMLKHNVGWLLFTWNYDKSFLPFYSCIFKSHFSLLLFFVYDPTSQLLSLYTEACPRLYFSPNHVKFNYFTPRTLFSK